MTGPRAVVVEDELIVVEDIRTKLKRLGYHVEAVAGCGAEAVQAVADTQPDLVLVDIGLPGEMDGVQVAEAIKTRLDIPVVYLTAHSDEDTLARAKVTTPFGYILKPFDARELRSTIEMALYRHKQERKLRNSEARYRSLFNGVPVALYRTTPDGQILDVNPALMEMLGLPYQEAALTVNSFAGHVGPVEHERWKATMDRDGMVRRFQAQWRRSDGTLIWAEESARVVRDDEGRVLYYEGVVEDITERKKAEEALAQRAAQLALLNDVSGQIAATLHLDSILAQAARLIQQKFGYHYVALFILDRQQQQLVMQARASGFAHQFPQGHRLALGQGVVGWVAESGQALLANDVDAEPRYVNLFPDPLPTRAELSVPIQIAGQVLGVLDVQSPQRDAFDENDVLVIKTLADQIAVAIDNARLYEAAQRELAQRKRVEETLHNALRDLEQHQIELSALLAGARAILRHREFEASARVIFDICKHLIGATAGYATLLAKDGTKNEVLFLDPGGLPCQVDPALPMPIRGLREKAYRTRRAVYHNDFAAAEWADLLPAGHITLNSVLFVPLVIDGQAVGLLGLANKPGGFDDDDARMAAAFGELAAVALHNSRTLEALEESEARFRSVVQTAGDAIITADDQGRIISWNRGAQEAFGYSAEEMVGASFARIMPEEVHEMHRTGLERFLASGESSLTGHAIETTGLRQDGSRFPLELSLTNWMVGEQAFFTIIARDVTERVQLQRESEHRRRYLESVLASAPDAIVTLDNQHCVLYWNEGARMLFGHSPQEAVGRNLDDLITGGNAPTIEQATRLTKQILAGQPVLPHETVRYRQDGTPVDVIAAGSPIYVGNEMVGIVAVYTDIAERKQVEQALQELNATLEERVKQRTFEIQVLQELTQEIGYTLNYDDLFRTILQHLHRVCEYDIAASLLVSGDSWQLFVRQTRPTSGQVVAEIQEYLLRTYERLASVQHPTAGIVLRLHQSEQYDPSLAALHHISSYVQVPIFARGKVLGIVYIGSQREQEFGGDVLRILYTLASQAADSIQRLRTLLAEEQQRLERLVENLPEGIVLLDATSRVLLTNPIAVEILSVLDGVGLGDVLTHLGSVPLDRILRESRGPVPLEVSIKEPVSKLFEVSAQPIAQGPAEQQRTIIILRDVTEARRLERQLQQQDQLAAVGQLAGGIAHDFNNILTTIILHSQVALRRRKELPERVTSGLETILDSGRRAADLVRQILDFSRHAPMETHLIDLRSFVGGVMNVMERTLPENILVAVDKGSTPCPVRADPTRIQQVLMNLAVNARDAMPQGGQLRVRLASIHVDASEAPPLADMPPGEWVRLSMSDTGTGIEPEVVAHIFEPFFTTKPKGRGTGLGLAQVYGIVKQHEGFIGVETAPGRGTTFHVYLPADGLEPEGIAPDERQETPPATLQGQSETILLVEDEELLRNMGREILDALGYQVLTAADGREALEVYRSARRVDLVITDMVMPTIGGRTLIQELRKQDPELKAVVMTGYALAEDMQALREDGIMDAIEKPFDEQTLAQVVRRTLHGQSPGDGRQVSTE